MRLSVPTQKLFVFAVGLLSVVTGLLVFLPGDLRLFPIPVSIISPSLQVGVYLGIWVILGVAGWFVCGYEGFAHEGFLHSKGLSRVRVLLITGLCLGAILIFLDLLFSELHFHGSVPHPPLISAIPTAFVESGIQEVLFRLVIMGGGMGILESFVYPKGTKWSKKSKKLLFWALAVFSIILSLSVLLPVRAAEFGYGSVEEMVWPPFFQFVIFYTLIGITGAAVWSKYGFFPAWAVHFIALLVWDGIWGIVWWSCVF